MYSLSYIENLKLGRLSSFDQDALTYPHTHTLTLTGTIRCDGETRLEMQEFCHYDELFRDMCAPPAHLILENIAISPEGTENNPNYEPCICGYRNGFRDCIGSE